jgi:lipoprotein-anchoring transpeptidase ErfK/SrfK
VFATLLTKVRGRISLGLCAVIDFLFKNESLITAARPVGLRAAASRGAFGLVVGAAALMGGATTGGEARAQGFFWSDRSYYYEPPARQRPAHRRAKRSGYPKIASEPKKDSPKPDGPLIIAISIDKQRLKIFDANGVWAESPVSTGTRSNPTPMGVFSVIQKSKWHRSNLYSGAPMPYMQRITWSGVALHAGVLPGYPASHGCIRLPGDFAARMWGWTKLGVRVVVTPGESEPVEISHPRLISKIIVPPPEDASAATPAAVAPAASGAPSNTDGAAGSGNAAADGQGVAPSKPQDDGPAESRRGEIELRLAPIGDDLSASAHAGVRTADASGTVAVQASREGTAELAEQAAPQPASPPSPDAVWQDAPPRDPPADAAQATQPSSPPTASSAEANSEAKPADTPKASAATPAPEKAPAAIDKKKEAAAKKRTGHVAAFISRKDSKLYVRQGFEAWFDVPVTIAEPDRPLGTHVFTAHKAGQSEEDLRWTVVTVPPRQPQGGVTDQSASRRGKKAPKVVIAPPALPPSNATEALERVTIPRDAMDRVATAIGAGGSLTISDQGMGPETGKGTDFIVLTR